MIVAPWLQNTSPADFLRAAEAGTSVGNEISRINLGRQINERNIAQQQQEMQMREQENQARNLLLNRELLQRARQSQAQNAIDQQANQSREMLGLIGEQRMEDDTQKNERFHDQQIGLEGQRVDLEKERNNRLRYIKSGNGAYSFDPTTGETTPIIENTTTAPSSDARNLLGLRNSYLDQLKITAPEDTDTIMTLKARLGNIDGKLAKVGQTASLMSLTAPPTLQPSIPAPSGPQVGDTVNGGVFAGGGVLPVGAGVPANQSPAAGTLQPSAPNSKPTPSRDDVSYLAAHPEKKSAFEARFGAGSADQYLP